MNYIECFNSSRAANCLQPVFRSWCASMLPGVEYCRRCTLCAVPGVSMLTGVECCSRFTFAPFLVPQWCQVWSCCSRVHLCAVPGVSMLPGVECCSQVHLCAFLVCLDAARRGVLPPCTLCARPGASMLARMEYYVRVPFAPVLVPPCWHGWSITPVCHLRPSWCLHAGMLHTL